ncbi:hypothetical protein GGR57DRAFT_448917 [Xylariaceae sp. FL1272]|nr:hypothetical protein GGR57DRAFT_448917 [Xylariaceae sp. FL1272]
MALVRRLYADLVAIWVAYTAFTPEVWRLKANLHRSIILLNSWSTSWVRVGQCVVLLQQLQAITGSSTYRLPVYTYSMYIRHTQPPCESWPANLYVTAQFGLKQGLVYTQFSLLAGDGWDNADFCGAFGTSPFGYKSLQGISLRQTILDDQSFKFSSSTSLDSGIHHMKQPISVQRMSNS